MKERGKGERREGRGERDLETNEPPNVECEAATSVEEPGGGGLVGSHTPLPFAESGEEAARASAGWKPKRCFPTPGVVAGEDCERARRNSVDTRNLSGE